MQDDSTRPLADDSLRHAEQHIHDVKLDGNGRLAVEINCADCGYNLQGADPKGCCSECGHPVAMSINISDLAYANPDWLQKLARGSGWVMISYLLFVPGFLIAFSIVDATDTRERGAYAVAVLCAAPIVTALGMWQMTTRDPRYGASNSEIQRQAIRLMSTYSITCPLVSVPIELYFNQHTWLMEFVWLGMRWTSLIVFLISYYLLFGYLSSHAISMRERNIAIQCKLVSLGGIATAIVVGFNTAIEMYNLQNGGWMGSPSILGCSLLLAAPIILLWSMGLIMLYHDALSLTAKHARTLHARMSKLPSGS